ncbi:bifunctional 2-polyprenyl-6-hydroxyphenol methylase/3-demethylubiquinol 3-O-methyltransferase UbiG [Oceanicoccus sp. KOV_DT_Chl]|uniref:class I SAM-dependent methyltransferase n=1 Tax=Oceanicoccus sp. KOV_DT_Chl TaxID=1904639 RepID=UPI000C7BC7EE|nr:class I SAM-dependent methyltransferase [Oceanicoccus sp. KOV_DT_Chl]
MTTLDDKTIQDFDEQWTRYSDNDGWYASLDLFKDMISPLLSCEDLKDKNIADIGSGTGRIVGMLLDAGASHVYAIEPATGAYQKMKANIAEMPKGDQVTCINARGDDWQAASPLDYVFSIGVIQFIVDPGTTLKTAYDNLKPGGDIFLWLYSYEGNELYLNFIQPLRKLTTKLPHFMLTVVIEVLYATLCIYRLATTLLPLPLKKYIETIWWPMTPKKRRLVIYDQLNPSHAKYHKKHEALEILEKSGFCNLEIHHRHGYSWCVKGTKPCA